MVAFFLALALQVEPREAVERGVRFPPKEQIEEARTRGRAYAAVVDCFTNLENWEKAVRALDERTGLFAGELDIRLEFADLGGRPAYGHGTAGKGRIGIDLKTLAEYHENALGFERRARKPGSVVVVPPAKLEGIIAHELAHCFQGGRGPDWFRDGMATWCQQDRHYVHWWRHKKLEVRRIDAEMEGTERYPRGWAFFEHLDAKHGRDVVKKFIRRVLDGDPVEKAAEITGMSWEALMEEERKWSEAWLGR